MQPPKIQLKFKKPYKIELADTLAGHWYRVSLGKRLIGNYASSTTILKAYPQPEHLTKWVADRGWNESQRIRDEAGLRGTAVHNGIDRLLHGDVLQRGGFSLEEWWRLNAFIKWFQDYHPEILATELPIFSKKYGFAGRTDVVARIGEKVGVGDWKTSGAIYDNFALQVASYATGFEEMYVWNDGKPVRVDFTFICQFGAKNKNAYRYVIYEEWREHFKTFLAVKKTWEYDQGIDKDFELPILDLPVELKL